MRAFSDDKGEVPTAPTLTPSPRPTRYTRLVDTCQSLAEARYGRGAAVSVNPASDFSPRSGLVPAAAAGVFAYVWDPKGSARDGVQATTKEDAMRKLKIRLEN